MHGFPVVRSPFRLVVELQQWFLVVISAFWCCHLSLLTRSSRWDVKVISPILSCRKPEVAGKRLKSIAKTRLFRHVIKGEIIQHVDYLPLIKAHLFSQKSEQDRSSPERNDSRGRKIVSFINSWMLCLTPVPLSKGEGSEMQDKQSLEHILTVFGAYRRIRNYWAKDFRDYFSQEFENERILPSTESKKSIIRRKQQAAYILQF